MTERFPHPKAVGLLEELEHQLRDARATLDQLLSVEQAAASLTLLRPQLGLMALSVRGFRLGLENPTLLHPRQPELPLTPPPKEGSSHG